ncbi:hypothetical protein SUGI_0853810 [Cryptomeria japonica]|nr:hypothetical protein SUGI_0853810 [Cryptomeria japonica]
MKVCIKKWVRKVGSVDADFVSKNHGKFMEPPSVMASDPARPSCSSLPLHSLRLSSPVLDITTDIPSETEGEKDGSESDGNFPFMEDIDDMHTNFFDDDFEVAPHKLLGLSQMKRRKSKPDYGIPKKKKGRKTKVVKIRIEGNEAMEDGSQWTM